MEFGGWQDHSPIPLLLLHFLPTNDYLIVAFEEGDSNCFWRLDTQQMVSLNINDSDEETSLAIIHLSNTIEAMN